MDGVVIDGFRFLSASGLRFHSWVHGVFILLLSFVWLEYSVRMVLPS